MTLTHRPKLLGLDLDGTVLDNEGKIPPDTLAALKACCDSGIKLAFLTGRRPLTARPKLDEIGCGSFVATNSGCLLWEYPSWKQLAKRMFPPELVVPVAEMLHPHSVNFHVDSSVTGFEFLHLSREPSEALNEYMRRYGKNVKHVTTPAELTQYEVTQVAMPGEDATILALRDEARARFDGSLLALAVRWPLMSVLALELFHREAHKGSALAFFAEQLRLTAAECLSVGDDVNDLTMLEWAGYSAAMPQSGNEVKAAVDRVLEGDDSRSLAPFLMQLVALPPA